MLRWICWAFAIVAAFCTWFSYHYAADSAGQAMPVDGLVTVFCAFAALVCALAGWAL